MYQTTTTVKPPISKHPKCQAQVVAYGTWLLTRAYHTGSRAHTLFQKQLSRTGSKIHFGPYTPKISMLILLTAFHTLHIILVEFNRFPERSRTSGLLPGLFSPGKCHNKIPGLSRFSRTRTNPVYISRLHQYFRFRSVNFFQIFGDR